MEDLSIDFKNGTASVGETTHGVTFTMGWESLERALQDAGLMKPGEKIKGVRLDKDGIAVYLA